MIFTLSELLRDLAQSSHDSKVQFTQHLKFKKFQAFNDVKSALFLECEQKEYRTKRRREERKGQGKKEQPKSPNRRDSVVVMDAALLL